MRFGVFADANLDEPSVNLFDLLALYSGRLDALEHWLKDAQPNLDRNLRLEYLAGKAFDLRIPDRIVAATSRRPCHTIRAPTVAEDIHG